MTVRELTTDYRLLEPSLVEARLCKKYFCVYRASHIWPIEITDFQFWSPEILNRLRVKFKKYCSHHDKKLVPKML